MADESYNFTTARTRLEDIVVQVRKKDTSLEKSLDLLEEGVRLANACTELIDHADWVAAGAPAEADCVPGAAEALTPDAADAVEGEVAETQQAADAAEEAEEPQAAENRADAAEIDPADEAWADDAEPEDDLGEESDPSADER